MRLSDFDYALPEALVAQAVESTGLEDFGAKEFREGLEVYCESAFGEAQLNELGTAAVTANVVGSLGNRLRVVDWAARRRPRSVPNWAPRPPSITSPMTSSTP